MRTCSARPPPHVPAASSPSFPYCYRCSKSYTKNAPCSTPTRPLTNYQPADGPQTGLHKNRLSLSLSFLSLFPPPPPISLSASLSLSSLLLALVKGIELGVLLPDPLLHEGDELVLLESLRPGRREHLIPEGDARGAPIRLSTLTELLVHLCKKNGTQQSVGGPVLRAAQVWPRRISAALLHRALGLPGTEEYAYVGFLARKTSTSCLLAGQPTSAVDASNTTHPPSILCGPLDKGPE